MICEIIGKDFCCFEEMKLSLDGQGLVYVRGVHNDSTSASSNGTGKSSLFKCLTWGLYGETVDGMKGDEIIRVGADEAQADVVLYSGAAKYHVTRKRRKGRPYLSVVEEVGGQSRTLDLDKTALQQKIVDIVGLDFKSFKNTVLYGQNDVHKFADPKTSDADRKDMLHRILGTEILQECHAIAKSRLLSYNKELSVLDSALGSISKQIDAINVDGLTKSQDEWESNQRIKIRKYKQQAIEAKVNAESVSDNREELDQLNATLLLLKDKLAISERRSEDQGKITKQMEKWRQQLALIDSEVSEFSASINQIYKSIKLLDGDNCAVCTAPLAQGAPAKYKKKLISQQKKLSKSKAEAEAKIEELKMFCGIANKKLMECEVAAREARTIRNEIAEVSEQLLEARAVNGEVAAYISTAKTALERAKELSVEDNPYKQLVVDAKAKVSTLKTDRKEKKKSRNELADKAAHVQFWTKGFSPQGVPSFLLDSVMPYITERANEYLSILTDGEISVEISTQKELKSNASEVRDQINIKWTVEGNEGVAKSGGQRTRVNLAIDFALMDLAATREGRSLDLMLIDEALDGLDAVGTSKVLQLLQQMRSRRRSIFVISHNDSMAEVFDKCVTVVRENGKSRLSL